MNIEPIKDELLEKSILASAMVSQKAREELGIRLEPNDFTSKKYQVISYELIKLASKGAEPDLHLLTSKLGDEYLNDLGELFATSNTAQDISNHCIRLKSITDARNLVYRAFEVINKAKGLKRHSDFTAWAVDYIKGYHDGYKSPSKLDHISNHLNEAREEFKGVLDGTIAGLKTGIADIDRTTNGFRKGEYVTIAGRPSQGKTSLGISIMKNMVLQGSKVGYFSLEMTENQNIFRLISMLSGGSMPYGLFRGTLKPDNKDAALHNFNKQASKLLDSNMFINASSYTSISDLENELRRFVRANGLDCVVIDYIGLIQLSAKESQAKHEKVAEISNRLRSIFKELEIVGIVLVQLNRDSHNKRPNMANLADTTQIERDSHFVYLIYQPDLEDKTKKILICDKGRDSGEGDYGVTFCTKTTEFKSMTREQADIFFEDMNNLPKKKNNVIIPKELF